MALKQYYPIDEDKLHTLKTRRRRLGVLWIATNNEIKELEAKQMPELNKRSWWSRITGRG